jgi:hypothetical protein
MAKPEQIVTDRKTMKELVAFMEDAAKEGLSRDKIASQVDLLLDEAARGRLDKSLRELASERSDTSGPKDELFAALHKS